ncbi:MAG TPA: hypothetical protein VF391_07490 [Dermatophilaceae bacterium]
MDRVPSWAAPARARIPEPPTWLSTVARLVAMPTMALLWWGLAFLAWQSAGHSTMFEGLQPTLPVSLGDLGVAVFGPLGASLVVIGLLGRWSLSLVSVGLGFAVSASVTLTRGVDLLGPVSPEPFYVNPTERTTMLVLIAVSALAGLGIGAFAIGSLKRFGFLGLLALFPVTSLVTALFLDFRMGHPWLTRSALVVLLVMIAWQRWSDGWLWPIFFVLYWLLTLTMTAVDTAAQTLRHRGGGTSAGLVVEAMMDVVRSAWRAVLGISWDIFWPAAIIAALAVAGQYAWRRSGSSVG